MDAVKYQLTMQAADLERTQVSYNLAQTQAINTAVAIETERVALSYVAQTQIAYPPTATALAAFVASENRARDREAMADQVNAIVTPVKVAFWGFLPLIVIVLFVVGSVLAYKKLMPILEVRARYVRQPGGELLYISGGGDQVTLTHAPMANTFGPSVTITPYGAQVGGIVSNESQALINYQTSGERMVRSFPPGHSGRNELESLLRQVEQLQARMGQTAPANLAPGEENFPVSVLPSEASWELCRSYRGLGLPVGILKSGDLLDPSVDDVPHRLFAGATGAGKSRRGARPAIAMALSRGFIVFSLGDMPAPDFRVFDSHPNYHSLVVNHAEEIIPYIESANVEVKARWEQLYRANASTWSRLPEASPRVLIVLDEYAALIDNLDGPQAKVFQNQVANLSRLSRKAGIHLLLGAQNPTRESVRPSIRRNMLTVVFRTTDQAASVAIMGVGGADRLGDRQFLSRDPGGQVLRGVAFDPSDNQIVDLLESNQQAPAHDLPMWLEFPTPAAALPLPSESAPDNFPQVPPPGFVTNSQRREAQIVELYISGKKQGEIEQAVFGYNGGRAYRIVASAIQAHLAATTTTTTQ